MKISVRIFLGFGLMTLLIFVSNLINIYASNLIENNIEEFNQSETVLRKSLELQKAIIDQETGLRGYLLTGIDSFKQPIVASDPIIKANFAELTILLKDNPEQINRIYRIKDIFFKWKTGYSNILLNKRKFLLKSDDLTDFLNATSVNPRFAKTLVDEIRSLWIAFDNREHDVRNLKFEIQSSTVRNAKLINILTLIAAGFIAISSTILLIRYLINRLNVLTKAADEVFNGNYELKIEDKKNDELRPLIQSFNKMSNEIQSNFKTLNENIAELEQFNWITSHDMKEPLRMISLYSEKVLILNEDKLDYNSIQDIKYIQKNVRSMINLINDVLEYVRSNDEDELKKTVLVDDIVKKLIEQNRELIENTNTKLEISNLKFEICCNEKILLQVFQNLLINSIKYRSDKDPILKIYASTDAKETIISFKDNGIGIDDEYQEKVFVMFQRLHDANDAEGTGIGLSICKKIINKMGGTIWVQPGLNVGTIIHIKIPTT